MKKIKLRELSPLVISVFILSIFIIGLVSAAATTNNGSIGGLFFRYVGDNGYDYNLQQFTSSGYRLDGRNIHTDFGGKDLTTTGSINNVNTVNSNILHTNGLGNGQIWLDGSRMDANTTINIGAGLVGGQTVKSVNLGGNLTVKGGNIDMLKGATSKIHSLGTMSFDWTLGGTYDYSSFHGIESKNEAGTFSDSMRINSYGNIINTIDSNANSISKFIIQKESSGNGVDLLTVDEAGNTIIAGKVTSSATVSADGINTLTTKKYVDDEVTKLVISCPTGQVLQSVGKNSSTCITDATIADTDTWITTQTCPTGQALQSVGKNSSICVGLLSGPRGPRGWTGLTGASGTAGTQGPRGLTGAPGTAGTQGLRGSQGIQGPAGGAASLVKFLKVTGGGRSGVGYCSGVWGTAKCDYSYDADITCAIGTYRLSEGWSVASTQNYKYICVTVQ